MVLHRDESSYSSRAHSYRANYWYRYCAPQILVAMDQPLHGKKIGIPSQENIPRNGCAVQCRVTTEDPEKGFTPDGKILSYRSSAGFGVRLDGAMGDTGSIITPFYDSLLVKITTSGPNLNQALDRMHRALREMRIRG